MGYGGYDIATALRNIEDIALYGIGWTRVTRLIIWMCAQYYVYNYIQNDNTGNNQLVGPMLSIEHGMITILLSLVQHLSHHLACAAHNCFPEKLPKVDINLLQINYTLLRLSHIHSVVVQIDTKVDPRCLFAQPPSVCVIISVVCSLSGLYQSCSLTTIYC